MSKNLLGKKNKRGPPPSVELKRVDINKMALREDAPDDIRAMAQAGKLGLGKMIDWLVQITTPDCLFYKYFARGVEIACTCEVHVFL